jgi:hypothetical protein
VYADKLYTNGEPVKHITVPNDVFKLVPYLFSFDSLESVKIADTVTEIDCYAFASCTALKSVSIPDSVETIGEEAFVNCYDLESLSIGSGTRSIGHRAFYNCYKLKSITAASDIAHIGKEVFDFTEYHSLSENWENGVLYIGANLIDADTSLTGTYKIKDGTKTIASGAFENCDQLEEIDIPESMEYINSTAFLNCRNLTSVKIPRNVDYIGENAFYNCTELANAYFEKTEIWRANGTILSLEFDCKRCEMRISQHSTLITQH